MLVVHHPLSILPFALIGLGACTNELDSKMVVDCGRAEQVRDMQGMSLNGVVSLEGNPDLEREFLMKDQVGEFSVALRNRFPLPDNANRRIKELEWHADGCNLAVWFALQDDDWKAVDAFRWPEGVQF